MSAPSVRVPCNRHQINGRWPLYGRQVQFALPRRGVLRGQYERRYYETTYSEFIGDSRCLGYDIEKLKGEQAGNISAFRIKVTNWRSFVWVIDMPEWALDHKYEASSSQIPSSRLIFEGIHRMIESREKFFVISIVIFFSFDSLQHIYTQCANTDNSSLANWYRRTVTWLQRAVFVDKRADKIASELRREDDEETRGSMTRR